jgi:hypothetical protein
MIIISREMEERVPMSLSLSLSPHLIVLLPKLDLCVDRILNPRALFHTSQTARMVVRAEDLADLVQYILQQPHRALTYTRTESINHQSIRQ